jgi:hypothetical protein
VIQTDVVTLNKKPLFRVIFKVGDMVYIDKTGQIVYVQMPPAADVQASSSAGSAGFHASEGHEHDD